MNKSHLEISEAVALRKLEEIDDATALQAVAVEKSLERFGRPTEDPGVFVVTASPKGVRNMEQAARVWRISRSAVARFLIADGLARYGFDATGILMQRDFRAMRRAYDVNAPLQNRSEALKKARSRGFDVPDLD
jgi:hypothetical protein